MQVFRKWMLGVDISGQIILKVKSIIGLVALIG